MLNPQNLDRALEFEESPVNKELYQSEKQAFKKRYLNPSQNGEYPGTSVKKAKRKHRVSMKEQMEQ